MNISVKVILKNLEPNKINLINKKQSSCNFCDKSVNYNSKQNFRNSNLAINRTISLSDLKDSKNEKQKRNMASNLLKNLNTINFNYQIDNKKGKLMDLYLKSLNHIDKEISEIKK